MTWGKIASNSIKIEKSTSGIKWIVLFWMFLAYNNNQAIAVKWISFQVPVCILAKFHHSQWTIHDWSNGYCDMWKSDESDHNPLKWIPLSIQSISSVQTRMLVITSKTVMDHFID
jgi:hypothetical protein